MPTWYSCSTGINLGKLAIHWLRQRLGCVRVSHWSCDIYTISKSPHVHLVSILCPSCIHLVSISCPPCIHLVSMSHSPCILLTSILYSSCFHLMSIPCPSHVHFMTTLLSSCVHLMSMSGNFVYKPPSEFFHSLILLLFHNNCAKNKLAQKIKLAYERVKYKFILS